MSVAGPRPGSETWDAQRADELATKAFRYIARIYPKDAPLEPLGLADEAAWQAQEAGDLAAFEEALREMCRLARRKALRRSRASRGAA